MKTISNFLKLTIVLSLVLCFSNCSSDDSTIMGGETEDEDVSNGYISFPNGKKPEFTFDYSGGKKSFTFESKKVWEIKYDNPEDSTWIKFSSKRGEAGSAIIDVSVKETDSNFQKESVFYLISWEDKIKLRIKQDVSPYVVFANNYFKNSIIEKYDLDKDRKISRTEAEAIKEIVLSSYYGDELPIYSLQGIELMTNLETLECRITRLKAVDLTHNTLLKRLVIYSSNIESLDLSHNKNLEVLHINNNKIHSLDISNNKLLTSLNCYGNDLADIELSNNKELQEIDLGANHLSTLDISNNLKIKKIGISGNKDISALHFSSSLDLEEINCSYTSISNLDVTKFHNLKWLDIDRTFIKSIDVTQNKELEVLGINGCNITEIDLSNNKKLLSLDVRATPLRRIDISNCKLLEDFYSLSSNIRTLDISKNREIALLYAESVEKLFVWKGFASDNKMVTCELAPNARIIEVE